MTTHSPKAYREKLAAVAEELRAVGIHEWRDTSTIGANHMKFEFEHGGRQHVLTFSSNNRPGAIAGARRDIRHIVGLAPKKAAQPVVRPAKHHQPCAAPQAKQSFDRHGSGNYKPRHPGEYNVMTAALWSLKGEAS